VRVAEDGTTARAGVKVQVKVGGENVGGLVEGPRRLNAETIAAWKAVSILENHADLTMEDASESDDFFDADEGGGVTLEDD
jgi:hypothetical protein